MRLGRVCCSLVLLVLSVLIPFMGDADAIPFSILPNGDLVIETTYTTQGVFTRCATHFIPAPACSSGVGTSSIVVGSGTNTAALTFFGVSATVPLNAGVGAQVPLGVIFASATPGFKFPVVHPGQHLVDLVISLDQSSPAVGADQVLASFALGGGGTQLPSHGIGYFELPIGALPQSPSYRYGSLIYSPIPFTIPSNGLVEVEARLGAVPEPATLLLFGTTMAGIGLARWRRRKLK